MTLRACMAAARTRCGTKTKRALRRRWRRKKNASVVMALTALGNGEGDGFVERRQHQARFWQVRRYWSAPAGCAAPALAPLLPTITGKNSAPDRLWREHRLQADWLAQFGVMGSVYMNKVRRVREPRVAILNNGVEEHKGNALVQQAYELLKQMPIHFVGNVEAREILSGEVDVVVADGFVGNVALKSIEGTGEHDVQTAQKNHHGFDAAARSRSVPQTRHGGVQIPDGLHRARRRRYGRQQGRCQGARQQQCARVLPCNSPKCEEMVNGEVPQLIGSEIARTTGPSPLPKNNIFTRRRLKMLLEQAQQVIAAQLKIDPAQVKPDSRLVEDLKADSLDIVELVMELEKQFNLENSR